MEKRVIGIQGMSRSWVLCDYMRDINMMPEFTYACSRHPINFLHSFSGWYDQDGARGVFYRAGGEGRWSDRRGEGGGRRRKDPHRLSLLSRKESAHQQRGVRLPLQRSVCGSHCATLHLYTLHWMLLMLTSALRSV